ncbi:MAG: hypothetical protein JXM70_00205 [Pirellulales bacterium]|nr:hypothetical protein [Pirellulales bacterium]
MRIFEIIHRLLFIAILPVTVILGCGGNDLDRVIVHGNVSFRGEPVADGSALFVPRDGTVGPSVAVKIVDGRYRLDNNGGIPVGSYRVEILAYRKHGGGQHLLAPAIPGDSRDHSDAPQQYLPEKYNLKSQLKISVDAGAGTVTKDFVLDG